MANKQKKRDILAAALKLHKAGVKIGERGKAVPSISSGMDYPSLYLDVKQAPELVGYDVEDEVTLVIKGEIVSHSKREHEGRPSHETFDIKIKQIGCAPKKA